MGLAHMAQRFGTKVFDFAHLTHIKFFTNAPAHCKSRCSTCDANASGAGMTIAASPVFFVRNALQLVHRQVIP